MSVTSLKLVRTKTPGVYKRGGKYVVTYRDPSGKPRKRFADTYMEAKRLKSALSADVSRGEYRAVSRVTFAEYAEAWIESYAGRTSRGIREQTRDDYRKRLQQDAIPFLGRMRLSEIEARDLDALAAHVAARGVKPNTVRLALAPVKALLATAHQRGEIRSNPSAGYRTRYTTPAVDRHGEEEVERAKALTLDELSKLLAAMPDGWRLFFEFLAQSGMRIGEAIELRWNDVNLGAGTVHVRRRFYRDTVAPPKTKYGRRQLRLSDGLSRSLWALRKETRAGDNDLVFTAANGTRIDASNVMTRVLKPAAVEAGLGTWVQVGPKQRRAESWVGFHTFRHTCASMLFRAGWNAAQVQRWLGHHKASFTLDTYIHLLNEDVPKPAFFDALTSPTTSGQVKDPGPTENEWVAHARTAHAE